ncbi:MAG: D-Ala-D-Ala carboxypeptidase family metallohydrolase [Chlamydiota bacterium]
MNRWILALFPLLLWGCSGLERSEYEEIRRKNCTAEYIYRKKDQSVFPLSNPAFCQRDLYPWEVAASNIPRISKDHFRCKGSLSNIPRTVGEKKLQDCGGKHGLPFIHGKENVYPVLVDLLNYIQKKMKRRVVITSGHRCPVHNLYVDASKENSMSKHMIAAEVDFYVQGMENEPMKVLEKVFQFYKEHPGYRGKKEYESFVRYEKKTQVSTTPWYNKEIFVKLCKKKEGRNLDNRHPYPYLNIQVRLDRDNQEMISFSSEKTKIRQF